MRLPIADDVVEWDLLLQVIWAGLAAGIGVMIAMSVAILGATRAADARRDGDTLDTIFYSALFVLGLAACAGAVVLGIVVMTSKD
jgi:F0F1-type ATP synthase membrane subunit c/vacuolar-type H+-ATPase subunit K